MRQHGGPTSKQFLFGGAETSLVVSLENVHDFPRLRERLLGRLPGRVFVDEGIGAVSAIGTGINATARNLAASFETLRSERIAPLAASTSSFRISLLVPEAHLERATRLLHARFVEEAGTGPARS